MYVYTIYIYIFIHVYSFICIYIYYLKYYISCMTCSGLVHVVHAHIVCACAWSIACKHVCIMYIYIYMHVYLYLLYLSPSSPCISGAVPSNEANSACSSISCRVASWDADGLTEWFIYRLGFAKIDWQLGIRDLVIEVGSGSGLVLVGHHRKAQV